MINNKTILITGGTGSFGKAFSRYLLENYEPKKVIIFSRDEYKQWQMKNEFSEYTDKMRYFIGDVRDKERLSRAFHNVDYVVHAAAMKQVPACEYNPFEAVKTNVHGAQNVIDAAIDMGIQKVVALSTDKAVNPINLYGGTKLVSDKLFISANAYAGSSNTCFSIVRYGNVSGSRGSIIPYFRSLIETGGGILPITDCRMTRFWITLEEGVQLVLKALSESIGGETYIAKLPSFKVTDLAKAICPCCKFEEIGIREGEKLHEVMITKEDSFSTYEFDQHYIIFPHMDWCNIQKYNLQNSKKVEDGFEYSSGTNTQWLDIEELKRRLDFIQ
ncbi:UDP-N-acetylglucosamine 4,6-dehydratase (inverting) [Paludicola sp. MB14-C6]|uniref:UDP-N-acetylglucosamine 4,6-dehydratase (inverting) n=1 Tax=Paludihabitans sp. MB14-C6 TaxID=3070656 RepID=UPI0027DB3A4A|nr:UDP-N-acetylglucosamine 4,6-dehydratase (inverting) [Paludicola sp. MB14-C6]WMJ24044.1 UDP-N-acetylglucosamine 4,6-dehydratase (inverting) [Paludicola sp. MB14-C6]